MYRGSCRLATPAVAVYVYIGLKLKDTAMSSGDPIKKKGRTENEI